MSESARSPQSLAFRRILFLAGVAVLAATTASAQGFTDDVREDWQRMKRIMMGMADAMPEDQFDYASTPEQRTFREQILHVAGGNVMLMGFLGAEAEGPSVDRSNTRTFGYTVTSKADVLQALSDSFDYGTAALQEFDDDGLLQRVTGPPFPGGADAGASGVLRDRPRLGHLRSDGGVFAPQRHRAAGEPPGRVERDRTDVHQTVATNSSCIGARSHTADHSGSARTELPEDD